VTTVQNPAVHLVKQNGWDPVRWRAAQAALAGEVEKVVALLHSVRRPDAHAVGDWTLADVAMHLSQAWVAVPGLAARDLRPEALTSTFASSVAADGQ